LSDEGKETLDEHHGSCQEGAAACRASTATTDGAGHWSNDDGGDGDDEEGFGRLTGLQTGE